MAGFYEGAHPVGIRAGHRAGFRHRGFWGSGPHASGAQPERADTDTSGGTVKDATPTTDGILSEQLREVAEERKRLIQDVLDSAARAVEYAGGDKAQADKLRAFEPDTATIKQ